MKQFKFMQRAVPFFLVEVLILCLLLLVFQTPVLYIIYAVLAFIIRYIIVKGAANGSFKSEEQGKTGNS